MRWGSYWDGLIVNELGHGGSQNWKGGWIVQKWQWLQVWANEEDAYAPPTPPPSLPNHEENESVNESRTLKPQVPTFSWKRMSDENELVQNTWWPSNLVTSQQHILTILPHYIRQTPWQCFASTPFLPQLQGLNYSICWCSCHTASDRPLGSASAPFLPQLQRP